MTSYVKIHGNWSNNFSLKVSKNYFSQIYRHKFGQKCYFNGVNLVEIGHFWWKWSKSGHLAYFGAKWRHMSTFLESGQIISTLKVSKNYFNQVYGQKSGKNVINGVNLVKIGHFLWKCSQSAHFGGEKWCHRSKFGESGEKILCLRHTSGSWLGFGDIDAW